MIRFNGKVFVVMSSYKGCDFIFIPAEQNRVFLRPTFPDI